MVSSYELTLPQPLRWWLPNLSPIWMHGTLCWMYGVYVWTYRDYGAHIQVLSTDRFNLTGSTFGQSTKRTETYRIVQKVQLVCDVRLKGTIRRSRRSCTQVLQNWGLSCLPFFKFNLLNDQTKKKLQVMTTIKPDFASYECNKRVKQVECGFLISWGAP